MNDLDNKTVSEQINVSGQKTEVLSEKSIVKKSYEQMTANSKTSKSEMVLTKELENEVEAMKVNDKKETKIVENVKERQNTNLGGTKMSTTIEMNKKAKLETEKSTVIFYGDSREVAPVGVYDYNDFSKLTKREQKMPGFDPQYRDFVDYIMKITHDIWEARGIGVIYDTYHNNVTMHLGSSNLVGIGGVIANTLQTLHSFPDRRLIGQNVIWSDYGHEGFLSSHRVLSTATNLGDSNFGPATGRKINFRTVIECATTNNRIHEEWLVRDNLWIVTQLGFDPHEVAKKMAKDHDTKMPGMLQKTYGLCEAMDGQFMPEKYTAKDDSVGELMLEMASRIYNYKYINDVVNYYHKNAITHFICDKDLNGHDEIKGMIVSLLSSIPNGSYVVERVTCNQRDGEEGFDVALRWRLRGMNEGIGFFGQPSGNHIEMMGINHYHVIDGKIKEEWITFDGLDVLKQMYMTK